MEGGGGRKHNFSLSLPHVESYGFGLHHPPPLGRRPTCSIDSDSARRLGDAQRQPSAARRWHPSAAHTRRRSCAPTGRSPRSRRSGTTPRPGDQARSRGRTTPSRPRGRLAGPSRRPAIGYELKVPKVEPGSSASGCHLGINYAMTSNSANLTPGLLRSSVNQLPALADMCRSNLSPFERASNLLLFSRKNANGTRR